MKTYTTLLNDIKGVLLEFDPNRGAPGRAIPQGQQARKDLGIKNKTSKRQEIYKRLSNHDKDRTNAFEAGRMGDSWNGSYQNTSTTHNNPEIDAAHKAGKPIDLSRIWGKGKRNMVAGTPAYIQQQKIDDQNNRI